MRREVSERKFDMWAGRALVEESDKLRKLGERVAAGESVSTEEIEELEKISVLVHRLCVTLLREEDDEEDEELVGTRRYSPFLIRSSDEANK